MSRTRHVRPRRSRCGCPIVCSCGAVLTSAKNPDQGQCTCQWTPNRGVPYRGWTPCVDDDHSVFDDDCVWTVDKPTEAA